MLDKICIVMDMWPFWVHPFGHWTKLFGKGTLSHNSLFTCAMYTILYILSNGVRSLFSFSVYPFHVKLIPYFKDLFTPKKSLRWRTFFSFFYRFNSSILIIRLSNKEHKVVWPVPVHLDAVGFPHSIRWYINCSSTNEICHRLLNNHRDQQETSLPLFIKKKKEKKIIKRKRSCHMKMGPMCIKSSYLPVSITTGSLLSLSLYIFPLYVLHLQCADTLGQHVALSD